MNYITRKREGDSIHMEVALAGETTEISVVVREVRLDKSVELLLVIPEEVTVEAKE